MRCRWSQRPVEAAIDLGHNETAFVKDRVIDRTSSSGVTWDVRSCPVRHRVSISSVSRLIDSRVRSATTSIVDSIELLADPADRCHHARRLASVG